MDSFDNNTVTNPVQPNAQPVTSQPSQAASTPASSAQSPTSAQTSQATPQTAQPAQASGIAALPESQSVKPPASQMVSNPTLAQPQQSQQKYPHASRVRDVAEILAGDPQIKTTINADGSRTVQRIPLDKKSIGMAIALEAISGALGGLAAGRGRGIGAAGVAGAAQGQRQVQQRQEAQQRDIDNQSKALALHGQIGEINARIRLNTADAEKYGADAIDKQVANNRASGVLDVDDSNLENGGLPMTQAELLDAMQRNKINHFAQIGPVAGRVEVTNPDGTKRWEATHLVIKDPNQPVKLTQEDWDRYAAAHVPGYPAGAKIGTTVEIPIRMKQLANEQLAAHMLTDYRLNDMRSVLKGTQWDSKVPQSVDFGQPGVRTAMQRFQKYVSHSNQHGMDIFESLQAMGADKRNPTTGEMEPNPDAKFVETVSQALGGWPVLEAVHNQLAANKKNTEEFSIIDSEAKANAVLANPGRFTADQVQTAHSFLKLSQDQGAKKAAQEARQRAVAEGKDIEGMYKTGVNPITGERLTLDNAPDSMLVDSKGRPVPQNQQTLYKPSQMERQTADTARQALAISTGLRSAVQKNPNLVGPLLGRSEKGLASLGFGNAESQKLLNDVSFLQSAATKVHTGRFSNEILKKMSGMIQPGMNTDQFLGALNSIDDVMGRYAQEDRLVTVADFKGMQTPANAAPQMFSVSAWLKANPKGDANAAKAAAQKAGYQVVQ